MMQAPLIGVERHRLATDGEGVTTLVAFHGCTLRCKYCLNPQCLSDDRLLRVITPQELVDELIIDNLYFLATGGGVTFGGGEPLMRSDFIAECVRLMPSQWKVNIETALNVPLQNLETVSLHIDHFIIDIKDMSPDIYEAYTGRSNQRVVENLHWLAQNFALGSVTIRLPHIPNYNTSEDIMRSRKALERIGFKQFDEFNYKVGEN